MDFPLYPFEKDGVWNWQRPDYEDFTNPYDDRIEREHVRRMCKWPEGRSLDESGIERVRLFLDAYPRFTGKCDAMVSWLCRNLAMAPPVTHGVLGLLRLIPVVVVLRPHGQLSWPWYAEDRDESGISRMIGKWLRTGQAFVIVEGFDRLLPSAKAIARTWIEQSMNHFPKARWFVNADTFAPAVGVSDAGLVLQSVPPQPSYRYFEIVGYHTGRVLSVMSTPKGDYADMARAASEDRVRYFGEITEEQFNGYGNGYGEARWGEPVSAPDRRYLIKLQPTLVPYAE